MSVPVILMILAGLVFYGHFLEKMSEKTGIPDILGLVLLGIVIGPVMKWVDPSTFGIYGSLLSSLVLALILFSSGTSLNVQDLKKYLAPSMGLVYGGYFATWAMVTGLCLAFFDMSFLAALFIGCILGGTSAAVVLVFISKIKLTQRSETMLTIESVKTDIITFIFAAPILGVMATGDFSAGRVATQFVWIFVASIAIGIVSGFVWSFTIKHLPVVRETRLSVFAAMLVMYGLTEYVGLSGALMAIAFGIVVGNIDVFDRKWVEKILPANHKAVTDEERDFISQINFLLKVYFFIYVGLSIQIDNASVLLWGALITLAIYALRVFLVKFLVPRDTPLFDKAVISTMAPKGMATAVLGGMPLAQGYVHGEIIQSLLYSGLILSIVYAVILFFLLDRKITLPLYRMVYGDKAASSSNGAQSSANAA